FNSLYMTVEKSWNLPGMDETSPSDNGQSTVYSESGLYWTLGALALQWQGSTTMYIETQDALIHGIQVNSMCDNLSGYNPYEDHCDHPEVGEAVLNMHTYIYGGGSVYYFEGYPGSSNCSPAPNCSDNLSGFSETQWTAVIDFYAPNDDQLPFMESSACAYGTGPYCENVEVPSGTSYYN
ncbi:MAG: hypothetical protein ACRDVP_00640, partial [Acidimicrobiales bacterium]